MELSAIEKTEEQRRQAQASVPASNKWISKADKAVLPEEILNIDFDDEEEEGEDPDPAHEPLDGGKKDDEDKDDSGGAGKEARMGGADEGAGVIPQVAA